MKHSFWKVLACGAMAASMLAGCSSSSDSSTDDTSTADETTEETTTDETSDESSSDTDSTTSSGDTIKIGLNYELSGPVADYGNAESKGSKLAIKLFNEREDKPFTVEAVEIDDKSDAAESTTAATKLIEQDGVAGIVGPATSAASIATYAIATDKQTPVISPSATQVDATINSSTGEVYEYAWRICFEDSYQGKAMALYAYDTLGDSKAVVFNEVSDYGQGLANAFTEEFESLGGTVVNTISYNAGDTDFSAAITSIQGEDVDVIYIAGYYTEAGKLIKQLKDDGIDVDIVGADGFDSQTLIDQAGTEYSNNIYYTTAYTTVDASDELTAFIDAYKAEYDEEPSMFAALGYDATNLLLDQLEASGATGEELNEAIKKADFSGITGSFTFDEDTHTPNKTVLVVELVDGVQSGVQEVSVD